jgi:hypothetical protein
MAACRSEILRKPCRIRDPCRDGQAEAVRHEGGVRSDRRHAVKRQHEPQRAAGDLMAARMAEKQARSEPEAIWPRSTWPA